MGVGSYTMARCRDSIAREKADVKRRSEWVTGKAWLRSIESPVSRKKQASVSRGQPSRC